MVPSSPLAPGPGASRRSLLLGLAAVGLAGLLAACAEQDPEPVGPAPITEVGAEAASPSGEYTAVIDAAGDSVGVLLRDASGQGVWGDDYGYSRTEPPALLWEAEADVLWVVPGDHVAGGPGGEIFRIAPRAEGGWSKEPAAELPEEIAARL